jgi:hypothetical protein
MKGIRWWYREGFSAELLQDDSGTEYFRLNNTTMPLSDWSSEMLSKHATEDVPVMGLGFWLDQAKSNYYDNRDNILVSVEADHHSAYLYRNQLNEMMFSYGCEDHLLEEWTDELIHKLVERWADTQDYASYTRDIKMSLEYVRKHAEQPQLEGQL